MEKRGGISIDEVDGSEDEEPTISPDEEGFDETEQEEAENEQEETQE